MGVLFKNGYRDYKEYHNSLDNKKFFQMKNLPKTIDKINNFIKNFDIVSGCLVLKMPYGETHLQKYNLFKNKHSSEIYSKYYNIVIISDSKTPIIEIANKFNMTLLRL